MLLRSRSALLALLPCLFVTGCALMHPKSSLMKAVGHPPSIDLQGRVSAQANHDRVIRFDIVFVDNKDALKQIEPLDAGAWFASSGRCKFRGDAKSPVQFHSWEFVPGEDFFIHLVVKGNPKAAFAFADYASPGKHRVSLLTSGSQTIQMNEAGISTVKRAPLLSRDLLSAPEREKVCPDD